jgi:hypothetical protein
MPLQEAEQKELSSLQSMEHQEAIDHGYGWVISAIR